MDFVIYTCHYPSHQSVEFYSWHRGPDGRYHFYLAALVKFDANGDMHAYLNDAPSIEAERTVLLQHIAVEDTATQVSQIWPELNALSLVEDHD